MVGKVRTVWHTICRNKSLNLAHRIILPVQGLVFLPSLRTMANFKQSVPQKWNIEGLHFDSSSIVFVVGEMVMMVSFYCSPHRSNYLQRDLGTKKALQAWRWTSRAREMEHDAWAMWESSVSRDSEKWQGYKKTIAPESLSTKSVGCSQLQRCSGCDQRTKPNLSWLSQLRKSFHLSP